MARVFNGNTANRINVSSTPVTAVRLTMACWFYADTITANYELMCIANTGLSDRDRFSLRLAGADVGDPVVAETKAGTSNNVATTSSGFSATTWQHACATFGPTTGTDRAVYLNGGSKGTNTTNRTPSGLNGISLGVRTTSAQSNPLAGRLAHAAIWSAQLDDAEVVSLAQGICPLLVRPGSLECYWPLFGNDSPEPELVGRFEGTITGTVTKADQPRMFYY